MYEAFYGLSADPFRLSSDYSFCFRHESYDRARAYLEYGLRRCEGIIVVTGAPGTGKTTLIGEMIKELGSETIDIAQLVTTQLDANELLEMVAYGFGLDVEAASKAGTLQRVRCLVEDRHGQGRRTVLIVDEAQNLSSQALEELRLLTNLQMGHQSLLQIVLVGQEELRHKLRDPALTQLHQRIVANCDLRPLRANEVHGYVESRLRRVGWCNDPQIAEDIYPMIHRFTSGVPRLINQVCGRLLLFGSLEGRHLLGEEDADTVIAELRDEAIAPRAKAPPDRRPHAGAQNPQAGPSGAPEADADPFTEEPPLLMEMVRARGTSGHTAVERSLRNSLRRRDEPGEDAATSGSVTRFPGAGVVVGPGETDTGEADPTAEGLPAMRAETTEATEPERKPRRRPALRAALALSLVAAAGASLALWRYPEVLTHAMESVSATSFEAARQLPPQGGASSAEAGPGTGPVPVAGANGWAPESMEVKRDARPGAGTEARAATGPDAATDRKTDIALAELAAALHRLGFEIHRDGDAGILVGPADTLTFEFDSTALNGPMRDALDRLAAALHAYSWIQVRLVGYTDPRGPQAYNVRLARKRAQAVADYLVRQGIPAVRLELESAGGRGQAEVSEALARRVDIILRNLPLEGSEGYQR
ncbi:MAG: AAA family ATPase [Gammaproteobacteria bacterium]|nr:AAA family ATPase [Gammaproteobacteria bacterium]NIR97185.1 AAA family ATPase [Gammaproteobacteria bacterium]NIT62902.1 AAA family ATPase [Gammaproteobacteria bacterium]NIV19867.1 AAA family ATPase [Gammaproteobacteria bacterium]NIY31482.1 AAA family ATPase [Gammaproteobacteria bacterium]